MYNKKSTAAHMQSNIFAAILRKGVRLMIQFDGIRAALPEMEKTLKEVGDSL